MKADFHYETSNIINVIICDGCKTGGQLKERLHIHRKHIRQPVSQYSKAQEQMRGYYCKRIFEILSFFKMRQNSKLLRESYEDYFIYKFKQNINMRI